MNLNNSARCLHKVSQQRCTIQRLNVYGSDYLVLSGVWGCISLKTDIHILWPSEEKNECRGSVPSYLLISNISWLPTALFTSRQCESETSKSPWKWTLHRKINSVAFREINLMWTWDLMQQVIQFQSVYLSNTLTIWLGFISPVWHSFSRGTSINILEHFAYVVSILNNIMRPIIGITHFT